MLEHAVKSRQNLVPFVRVKPVDPETRVGDAGLRLIPEEAGNALANKGGLECAPRFARENDTGTVRKQEIETVVRPSEGILISLRSVTSINAPTTCIGAPGSPVTILMWSLIQR